MGMRKNFDRLAEFIKKEAAGRQIVYISNPGNFGDALLRVGAKKFLFDYKIDHLEFSIGMSGSRFLLLPYLLGYRGYFFVYGGGGAWHSGCMLGYNNCNLIGKFSRNFIIMPSTFGHLKSANVRAVFFRRDNGISIKYRPDSYFCDDMALYYYLIRSELPSYSQPIYHTGNFFRTDNESLNAQELQGDNIDLSILGNNMSDTDYFFAALSKYSVIETDRLHVAIGGAILGRQVHLYPGNYSKINDVYEASLAAIPEISLKSWEHD